MYRLNKAHAIVVEWMGRILYTGIIKNIFQHPIISNRFQLNYLQMNCEWNRGDDEEEQDH